MYIIHGDNCDKHLTPVSNLGSPNRPKYSREHCRYVIGVRTEANGLYVQKIETLVSDAGDWLFNATGTAYWNSLERWDPIPVADRDTREVIQAAGDAYFDRFGNVNVTVPFGMLIHPSLYMSQG